SMLTLGRRPAWLRHPALTTAAAAPALAIVVIALLGHAVTLASQRAINLDGSHSALAPATGERLALDLTAYYASGALLLASYVALLMFCLRGRIRGLGR